MYGEAPLYRALHWLPYSVKTGGRPPPQRQPRGSCGRFSFSLVHLDHRLISVTAAPGQIRAPIASLIIPGDGFRLKRAGRLELELFSMLCSHEIFTDQSYHAWIRSEKNSSIRSDACMTADYARGQPASAWPLAGQPCKVDCDLHTIARTHNRSNGCSPIGTLCPRVAAVV